MAFFRHIQRPALLPLCLVYGLAVLIRNFLFDIRILRSTKFKIPVISVGNISAGGTGKTPHVEYMIQFLGIGFRMAVLSRGYKRKTRDFVLAGKKTGVSDIGDEPMQIKLKYPHVDVAVDRNRVNGVRKLMEKVRKLDLIILDDAFQHRYIQPGLSILLVDHSRPIFNDVLLPAGNLREPAGNKRRADLIIVTKCPRHMSAEERGHFTAALHPAKKQKVYFTRYSYGSPVPVFKEKTPAAKVLNYTDMEHPGTGILLVTGIANPLPLQQYLKDFLAISGELRFPDHRHFTSRDLKLISATFKSLPGKEKYIVTTEKDAVRLREAGLSDPELKKALYYIPVEVIFLAKGEKSFIKKIYKFLRKSKGNKA
jgi:tetraacyldisaccharide 4'-kinase